MKKRQSDQKVDNEGLPVENQFTDSTLTTDLSKFQVHPTRKFSVSERRFYVILSVLSVRFERRFYVRIALFCAI